VRGVCGDGGAVSAAGGAAGAGRRGDGPLGGLPAFWEAGGDEITPTMKLRRAPIAAKYADVIESMYATTGEPAQASTAPGPTAQ